jgi:hypothetical protein
MAIRHIARWAGDGGRIEVQLHGNSHRSDGQSANSGESALAVTSLD